MTYGLASTAPAVSAAARMFAFVLTAWRALSPRHFGYAALAGLAIGAVQSVADLFQSGMMFPWADVVADIGTELLGALMLLLSLAIASNVEATRTPKWLPFVLAPVVVASIVTAIAFLSFPSAAGVQSPPERPLFLDIWEVFYNLLVIHVLASLGYMRGMDAWRRANALRDMQLEKTRLARKAFEARLQALQARVDPRFLFETLALIETTYAADPAHGQRVMDDLIVYLRAALPALDESTSSLDTEWTLVRTWLDIKRVRYGDRLSFSLAGPQPVQDARMPPMVLQPLVQYAVESIVDAPYDRPHIAIEAGIDAGRVRLAVTVPGPAFATAAETSATTAIRERLSALYGADASLVFRRLDGEQSRAELEIPHERSDRHHR